MWKSTLNGRPLHFYLAGINNQNFLMRDRETGSWWQQISGKAIYGPLRGASLERFPSDELTFAEWKNETSDGQVLAQVPRYKKEYDSKWEPAVAKLPVVISFPGTELKSRDVVVGIEVGGVSRAYPWETALKQSPVMDRVRDLPVLLVVAPDGKSFRMFVSQIANQDTEFFLKGAPSGDNEVINRDSKDKTAASGRQGWAIIDSATGSEWDFQGCAISGPSQGKCLARLPALKDYWFDWRNYHPTTTIYRH